MTVPYWNWLIPYRSEFRNVKKSIAHRTNLIQFKWFLNVFWFKINSQWMFSQRIWIPDFTRNYAIDNRNAKRCYHHDDASLPTRLDSGHWNYNRGEYWNIHGLYMCNTMCSKWWCIAPLPMQLNHQNCIHLNVMQKWNLEVEDNEMMGRWCFAHYKRVMAESNCTRNDSIKMSY